jgi:hypothetical protein
VTRGAQRGNARSAVALTEPWIDSAEQRARAPTAVDLDDVRAYAEQLARPIERSGLSGFADADLRPRLRGPDLST